MRANFWNVHTVEYCTNTKSEKFDDVAAFESVVWDGVDFGLHLVDEILPLKVQIWYDKGFPDQNQNIYNPGNRKKMISNKNLELIHKADFT